MEFNSTSIHDKHIISIVVISLLIAGNLFLGVQYFLQAREIRELKAEISVQQTNGKVVNFLNLFIVKVLKSDREVSFEDRLQLENAIRSINDPELLAKWEQFTAGTNEAELQAAVKVLLEALGKRIIY